VVGVGDTFAYSVMEGNTGTPNSFETLTITEVANSMVYFSVIQTFDNGTAVEYGGWMDILHMWNYYLDGFAIWPANLKRGAYIVNQVQTGLILNLLVHVRRRYGIVIDHTSYDSSYSKRWNGNHKWLLRMVSKRRSSDLCKVFLGNY